MPKILSVRLAAFVMGVTFFLPRPTVRAAEPIAFTVRPDQPKQVVWGLGFEIQSDSIGSGNHGLPDHQISVPHDLVPAERQRFYDEMLRGFRYCRLAGGLYWRGLDPEGKFLRPRWPEQLNEIRGMLRASGVEGVMFEYWSPAPFWKANGRYVGDGRQDPLNTLRCFGPDFANDPVYKGDVDRFLTDFAAAVVTDLKTLKDAGIPTVLWGLQNEPWISNAIYPTCRYPDAATFVRAYRAVAGAVRKHDPKIVLTSDGESHFPKRIATAMNDPELAALVDAYVVHTIGLPSEKVRGIHARITAELPARPWFQNEYEYTTGGASPERCLNTAQHLMDSFQLAGNPTWFWLHALKPTGNAEASGYSLGFWRPQNEPEAAAGSPRAGAFLRWRKGPEFTQLPAGFEAMEMVSATRGDVQKPGIAYSFLVNQPVTVHLLVEDLPGSQSPGEGWTKTEQTAAWPGGRDVVYRREFPAGSVQIPAHEGRDGDRFGAPHVAFIQPSAPATFKPMIGVNVPIQIRSEQLALERKFAGLKPGHWMWNPHNWNAVGSFVKRLPWNSTVVAVDEKQAYDADARVLAFRRPADGKLTVVLSNRSAAERPFTVETGRPPVKWRGFRYRPDEAGEGTLGVPLPPQDGPRLSPALPAFSWEFWEEQ